jgi:hypothetical protein
MWVLSANEWLAQMNSQSSEEQADEQADEQAEYRK